MRHLMYRYLLASLLCATVANAFTLMKDGAPACSIVLLDNVPPTTRHAAEELAAYLKKISGGDSAPAIGTAPTSLAPIYLKLDAKAKCEGDGFVLAVTSTDITITARTPLGLLYGAYNLLKESTGIRWVFPGADGEYYTRKSTIEIANGSKSVTPSFEFRTLSFHCMATNSKIVDTLDWMVRNGLCINTMLSLYKNNKELSPEYQKRGAKPCQNPAFSSLLAGAMMGNTAYKANLNKLWEEHPEYFPIINGKRTMLEGQKYQPCTSNPDVIRICADSVINLCVDPLAGNGYTSIYNDDGTGWCQCDNCKKLDTSRDVANGWVSNRFWHFISAMAKQIYAQRPDADIFGMGYQNFQAPPEIPIDPRLGVTLSFNRVCYRHNIDDPKCLLNYGKYYQYYEGWAKKGIRVHGREELGTHGSQFQPAERTYVHLLKYYKQKNFQGTFIAIAPPDGRYAERWATTGTVQWRSMWQLMYLHALYLWDIDADFEKNWEEMNALYYGQKAWDGGMREFRKLFLKAANETPGCFGHGFSAPIGRCLDQPGVHEKLRKHLADAEKAAATDPDPRALAHVKFDIQRFHDTWEEARETYLKNYRELRAYTRTAPIKIDGILDDPDWKNADIISNFKRKDDPSKTADPQTYLRVVHEPEYIYFGMEMLEPTPKDIVTEYTKRDGEIWHDNTVEVFLSHPDMGDSFFHFIFNAAGAFYDRKVAKGEKTDASFNCNAEVKARVLDDRWVLEFRLPTAELGEKCFVGQSWKVNVMRVRKLKNSNGDGSTLTGGAPFDVGTFLTIAFADKRIIAPSLHEGDARGWKNGGFNEVAKSSYNPAKRPGIKDNLAPIGWGLGEIGKGKDEFTVMEMEPNSGNYYIHVNGGALHNDINAVAKRYRMNFKYRGKGQALFYIYRYDGKTGNNLPSILLHTLNDDQPEWTRGKFEFDRPGNSGERHVLAIRIPGEYDFDDVFLSPIEA